MLGCHRVPPSLPRRFGRYTLLKSLRRGAMGEAFLAASGEGEEAGLCVIKLALPELPPEGAARFADEARVMRRLSFSPIARVFDSGAVDGIRFLAMEYVEGWNLDEVTTFARAAGLAVPVPVAVFVAKEIARGLHYAHALPGLSLIHRDVAPANVMLGVTGEVKLIDFGLARSTVRKGLTVPGAVLGHVGYFAPERLGSEYDHRSDLYAAGVILWELLAGLPFASGDAAPPRAPGALPRPPSSGRPDLDPALDAIVCKALAPAPADRFQDGEALRAALGEFLGRTAPATDSSTVAAFLREVIGEGVIDAQRRQRERLLSEARGAVAPSSSSQAAEPQRDPAVGNVLDGKYRLERLVGVGGMGHVYEGRHLEIGRRVAVKILKAEHRDSPEFVERFMREARLASRADSDGIVQVTDTGLGPDGSAYLVMEYLEGETLRKVMDREGRMPVARALAIAIAIARGLESAHGAGIVHRDLKPSNVMMLPSVDVRPRIKLLDFGISKSLSRAGAADRPLTRPLVPIGTPEYMAPEQALGLPADVRADVYALGAVLFEMLTGQPPFTDDDPHVILDQKQIRDAPRLRGLRPDVAPALEAVVARALDRSKDARHASVAELRAHLEVLVPSATLANAPSGAASRRAPLVVVGVAALVVAGGAAWLLARGGPPPSGPAPLTGQPSPGPAAAEIPPVPAAPPAPPPAAPPPAGAEAPREAMTAGQPARPAGRPSPRRPEPSPRAHPVRAPQPSRPSSEAARARELAKAAAAALNRRDYVDAIELGDEALAAGARDVDLHLTLGTANLMLDRTRQAEVHFRTAASLDPGNERAAEGLAASRSRP